MKTPYIQIEGQRANFQYTPKHGRVDPQVYILGILYCQIRVLQVLNPQK